MNRAHEIEIQKLEKQIKDLETLVLLMHRALALTREFIGMQLTSQNEIKWQRAVDNAVDLSKKRLDLIKK